MNPKPFASLNHFTVPFAVCCASLCSVTASPIRTTAVRLCEAIVGETRSAAATLPTPAGLPTLSAAGLSLGADALLLRAVRDQAARRVIRRHRDGDLVAEH